VHDLVLALELAAHAEEGLGAGEHGVSLEDVGPEHQVDEAGLVLEGHEDHALRRAGLLAVDHQPGVAPGSCRPWR